MDTDCVRFNSVVFSGLADRMCLTDVCHIHLHLILARIVSLGLEMQSKLFVPHFHALYKINFGSMGI